MLPFVAEIIAACREDPLDLPVTVDWLKSIGFRGRSFMSPWCDGPSRRTLSKSMGVTRTWFGTPYLHVDLSDSGGVYIANAKIKPENWEKRFFVGNTKRVSRRKILALLDAVKMR